MKIGNLVMIRQNAGLQDRFLSKSGIIIGNKSNNAEHYGQNRAWQVLVGEIILPLVFTDELELIVS